MVLFQVLLCGELPFTLQVEPNQKMCPRRMPSAFLPADAQSMGQARAGQRGAKKTPNCRSCGHEVLSNVSLCRPAPIALQHLLAQSPRGSPPKAHVPYVGDNRCLI